jgi:hypothetical protein
MIEQMHIVEQIAMLQVLGSMVGVVVAIGIIIVLIWGRER